MLTFKIHANKYISLFTDVPDTNFIFFNWDYKPYYLFGMIPLYIIYTKRTKQ